MTARDPISSAIDHLIRDLPKEITGSASFAQVRERLYGPLERELKGTKFYEVSDDEGPAILSLKTARAWLYRLREERSFAKAAESAVAWLTISREILHLEGAGVRHVIPLGEKATESLSIALTDKRVLRVARLENGAELRDELEKRALGERG